MWCHFGSSLIPAPLPFSPTCAGGWGTKRALSTSIEGGEGSEREGIAVAGIGVDVEDVLPVLDQPSLRILLAGWPQRLGLGEKQQAAESQVVAPLTLERVSLERLQELGARAKGKSGERLHSRRLREYS